MLMKDNFLSLMGMRLKGRRMNDPEITRKSPGNHPVITPFPRLITSTLLLLFTFAIGNVWGAAGDAEVVSLTSGNITKNRAKAYAVVTGNDVLEDGAIYATSRNDLTANADNGIEPNYMGFLFKPIVNCKVVLKGINTATSVRNFSNKVYEVINTDMYPIVKASSSYDGTISKYLLDNYTLYTTRTQSEWKDVKLIKYSNKKYQEDATNAAKTVTGEAAQTALYTQISDIQVISIAKKASSSAAAVEESKTFATEDGEYIFQAGKTYAIYLHRSSSGLYVKDISFVPVYQLTWDLDGGTIISAADAYSNAGYYAKGTEITAPTVTKAGSDFKGWSPAVSTMPAEATTYTATWATACSAGVPGNVTKGALTAGEITLTAEGSAASGDTWYWQTSESGVDKTNAGSSFVATAAGTYYVRSYNTAADCWNVTAKSIELTAEDFLAHYAITYNKGAYGTGEIAGGEKVEGVAYTLSSERFTRAGYVQTGWSLTDGGAKAYDLGGSYTTDAAQEFFPVWAETSTYVASFNSGEGCSASTPDGWTFANAGSYGANDATADFECKFGENFPTSAAEVVKNASYIAFAKAAGACATYDLGSATTVSALAGTFYVGSGNERTFTIEYLAANGTTVLHTISTTTNTNWGEKAVNDATVVPNVKYIRINPAHAGNSYSWLVMKAFSVTYVDLVTKYNVSFDKNGGSGDDMATLRYAEDALVTLPGCTFTAPTNKTFDAWTSEDVEISSNQFTMPNKNVTIKATWKFLPKLTLTAGEGATGDDVVAYYAAGTQISVPEKPAGFSNGTKDFTGWVYSQAVPIEADKFAMPSTDLTLTAQWASATAVAQILGGDSYETFADAIAAVAAGQTIQLLADCSYDAAWNLTVAGTVTLDLNGKNLTYTGSGRGVQVHNGAKLILEDGTATVAPTIDLTADPLSRSAITYTSGTFDSKDGMCATAGGEIEINSGTYLATEGVVLVAGNTATVTVNDGVLISRDNAVLMGNGSNNDNYRNYTMNVHGGILLGEIFSAGYASMVIYHPNVGTLNIDGGTLVSTNGPAVVCRGGESNITGGTIVAQGSGSGKCGDASLVLPAVGVAYDFKSAYPGVSSFDAKISGDANVSGAAGAVQGIYAGATPTTAEQDAVAISGGTFNSPVAQALCAEGYIPSAEIAPGKYGVIATAKSVDFTASDVQALGVGTAMSTYNYTLASTSGVSFDNTNAYDTGLKMKNSTTNTLSFVVEPGKLVTIITGNIAGMTYSVNGGAATALNGGTDEDHLGYTYLYNDAVQNIVLAETSTTYNIIRKITITDPYEVTFNANGGDEIAAQFFYGTALTLPGATKGTESFLGWFDGETKVGEAGDKYTPTANITLKAHWEAISTDARLASITFSSNAGTLSPAFDPEVTNYTYTMPYGTADVPTITGATKANPAAKAPVIDAQATAWGETAHVRGVAASDDTKDYYVQMLRAPKDGTCIVKADLAPGSSAASITATSGAYKDEANIAINVAKDLKLGETGAYVKVAVTDTYFQDGDVVKIELRSDKNASAWLQIFADEGTTLVAEMTSGVSNASPNYLTISGVPANTSALYLYRTETAAGNMNPYPTSMAVLRAMNPKLKSITIDGTKINVTSTTVSETLPYGTNLTAVTPEYYWNGAGTAVVTTNGGNWAWGENTYVLTDKDGDATTYTIILTEAEHYEAKIGETGYATLVKAVEEAVDGDVIVLQENVAAGAGVMIAKADAKQITIDFGGYTYTANSPAVGSVGTQNQAFHFEKGCNITLKNGTITSEGSEIKMLIQNYGDLTLENITLDGSGLKGSHRYVMSNNCGDVVIGDGATITAKPGDVAFDVCATNYYPEGVTVTVKDGATINGIVEYDVWGTKPADNKAELAIEGGNFNITWNVEAALAEDAKENLNVSGGQFNEVVPADYCAPGYAPVTTPNDQGKYIVQLAGVIRGTAVKETIGDAEIPMYTLDNGVKIYSSGSNGQVSTSSNFSTGSDVEICGGDAGKYAFTSQHMILKFPKNVSGFKIFGTGSTQRGINKIYSNPTAGTDVQIKNVGVEHTGTFTGDKEQTAGKWCQYVEAVFDANNTIAKDEYVYVNLTGSMYAYRILFTEAECTTPTVTLANKNAYAGTEVTLTAEASALGATYTWYRCSDATGANPQVIADETAASYTFMKAVENEYIKVVVGCNCSAETAEAVATVLTRVDVTLQDVTGSITWDFSKSGITAETNIPSEIVLANIPAVNNDENFWSDKIQAGAGKLREGYYQGGKLLFHTTVPGLLTVEFSNTGSSSPRPFRELLINGNPTDAKSKNNDHVTYTVAVKSGDIELTARIYDNDGNPTENPSTLNFYLVDFDADLSDNAITEDAFNGYTRDVTEGRYGTICLPNGGIMVGAELYEVAYYDGTYEKIFLDEVLNGEMVAGRPYIFLTKEGVNQIAVFYTDAAGASAGDYRGLFGSYTKINLAANGHIYILKDNRYYFVDTDNVFCGANRAYFKMGVDGGISGSYVAPAPGRRRTSIGAGAPAVATGVEDVQGDNVQCTKVLINGELFIIRGEKMYDAKGQLVK